jgi:hypothetical protein
MKTSFFLILVGLTARVKSELLAPANDILFPSSKTPNNPLQYAGGNSPYFAGQEGLNLDRLQVVDLI